MIQLGNPIDIVMTSAQGLLTILLAASVGPFFGALIGYGIGALTRTGVPIADPRQRPSGWGAFGGGLAINFAILLVTYNLFVAPLYGHNAGHAGLAIPGFTILCAIGSGAIGFVSSALLAFLRASKRGPV